MEFLQLLSDQAAAINAEGVPWALRLVMSGLGLSLTLGDLWRVFLFPKAVAIGVAAQLVCLPVTAFALTWVFSAPPEIAVGLVIIAACPSGVTSNAYSFAARADVPLCVTLSAVTSVVTVFTIPFLIEFAFQIFFDETQEIAISPTGMLLNLMTITLLPLALGMLIRHFFPTQAIRLVGPIRKTVLFVMMTVVFLGVLSNYQEILEYYVASGSFVVAMNLITMVLGYGIARLFALPMTQVITITFEVGVQNLALAYAIIFNILKRPDLAVTALIYAAVMPATALCFVPIAKRLIQRGAADAPQA